MRSMRAALVGLLATALGAGSAASAEDLATVAKAFGTRAQIRQISLSPDGSHVAIITSLTGAASALMIADPIAGGQPAYIIKSDGNPERLWDCAWITSQRVACELVFYFEINALKTGKTRLAALDLDGKNLKELSVPQSSQLSGGDIIDWTAGGEGSVDDPTLWRACRPGE